MRQLRRSGSTLWIAGRAMRLGTSPRVHLVAFGKAAGAMVEGAQDRLGPWSAGGIAVARDPPPFPLPGIQFLLGEHPVPKEGSLRSGGAVLEYVRAVPSEDAVLFLVSGGASSLLEAPWEGMGLWEISQTYAALLGSGAPIEAVNAIRRHLSPVKGGRVAEATATNRFATLAISDVVGDAPHDIASGPTVPDPSSFLDALHAVTSFHLEEKLPLPVLEYLKMGVRGARPETPKPTERRLAQAPFALAASTRVAVDAAASRARRLGYRPLVLSSRIVGRTEDVARVHAAILVERARAEGTGGPWALLSGGETTVTLPAHSGRGGRNQQFALAAVGTLDGVRRVALLSIGTDGIDGPTDAAGGCVTGATAERARSLGLDVDAALEEHASYEALGRLGCRITTGPTGTNVSDLNVGLVGPAPRGRSTGGTGRSSRRSGARASRRRRS
ncbi:MAG: DUF4147 domain-containing protein [Thermoplasmata archaeon]|nr:DUF4147 domain-containing protein [Thermoplasmata archaeon]